MENHSGDSDKSKARQYLNDIGYAYVLNQTGTLYQPKTDSTEEEKTQNTAGKNRESPLQVDLLRDWMPISISVLTFLLLCATVFYAHKQWGTMNDTWHEMQKETYVACLNAQAAQDTYIQVLRSAADTHAATAAGIKEAAAQLESQRAVVFFAASIPATGESIDGTLNLPSTFRNEGKSSATIYGWIKATMLSKNEKLAISKTDSVNIDIRMAAGTVFPPKSEDPKLLTPTLDLPVRDAGENIVQMSSLRAASPFNDSNGAVFVYGKLRYLDFSGVHRVAFCYPLFTFSMGTRHLPTQAEISCSKYNKQTDDYDGMPEIQNLEVNTNPIKPITCNAPSQ